MYKNCQNCGLLSDTIDCPECINYSEWVERTEENEKEIKWPELITLSWSQSDKH
jgi:hypothetical protein